MVLKEVAAVSQKWEPRLLKKEFDGIWEEIEPVSKFTIHADDIPKWSDVYISNDTAKLKVEFGRNIDETDTIADALRANEGHWRKVLGDRFYDAVVDEEIEVDESAFDYGEIAERDDA